MAVDPDVVGWVGEDYRGRFAGHQTLIARRTQIVATE
jgi:hypothetical protein